jgi:hypothetical protein
VNAGSKKRFVPVRILFFLTAIGFFVFSHIPMAVVGAEDPHKDAETAMQILITMALTGASLFVILSTRYGPKDKHWAYATVGTILGFWLHF